MLPTQLGQIGTIGTMGSLGAPFYFFGAQPNNQDYGFYEQP